MLPILTLTLFAAPAKPKVRAIVDTRRHPRSAPFWLSIRGLLILPRTKERSASDFG